VFSLIAFCTSLLTAVTGLGGGLILLGLMPGYVPAAALIPVHAVVQLASNSSRAVFGWQHICWQYMGAFLLGSLIGGLLASQVIRLLNLDYITLLIGVFILFSVWLPGWASRLLSGNNEMLAIGVLQTGLGTAGANTGPLANASLMRLGCEHDEVVTTVAAQMSVTHLIKIFAFAALGVSIWPLWPMMLGMSIGVVLGSWVGTRSRKKLDAALAKKLIKGLLTLLALRMIGITLIELL